MTREQSPTEAIREHQRLVDAHNNGDNERIPDDVPLTELAEDVVRGKRVLSQAQMRMLIELLPYYAPKLSAVAMGWREGQDMASKMYALERRNDRAKKIIPLLLEGKCVNGEVIIDADIDTSDDWRK